MEEIILRKCMQKLVDFDIESNRPNKLKKTLIPKSYYKIRNPNLNQNTNQNSNPRKSKPNPEIAIKPRKIKPKKDTIGDRRTEKCKPVSVIKIEDKQRRRHKRNMEEEKRHKSPIVPKKLRAHTDHAYQFNTRRFCTPILSKNGFNLRGDGVSRRLRNAAATLCNDNQSLIVEARKVLTLMKEVGVDLERDNEYQMVKELDDAAIHLAETYGDCVLQSLAIESIGNSNQPGTELTGFKKLLMDEFAKSKASSSSIPEKDPLIRHFREAVWNVHHAGEPMPGEEQEDIIMTSTQSNLLNITCPLSGKPIFELAEPVHSPVSCSEVRDLGINSQPILEVSLT
ncbi:hypothetical protein Ddye_026717 [Dipteronia dyeriana]|uniref:SP-RING-type domain-containing protein n=1 Tax=Dipteronia dyeriana TaxID=168575 RepID=A0AAD9TN89_9ROSI|nr:hypothetical protein Ddye_026717 [Dipteronia dyeriana]